MERRLETGVPLVFLKSLRQNATGEVTGGWKEACDADVQKLCSPKHHYESKRDKTGVTGMRKQEIHTQTFAMPKLSGKNNIKMYLKSK
jgi:hypothetical protein